MSAVPAMLLNLGTASAWAGGYQYRTMVNLHGPAILSNRKKGMALQSTSSSSSSSASATSRIRTTGTTNLEPPPNPSTLLSEEELEEKAQALIHWLEGKRNVLCITGAGLSTESGLADYRGHQGSYHKGHKPIIHDQFMNSEYHRKRYWARGMVGWRHFDTAKPNVSAYYYYDSR
jgi:Sir2 family